MAIYRATILSDKSVEEINGRLRALVGASSKSRAAFVGRVEGDRFSIRRDALYKNSYLPRIWGKVLPTPSGSALKLTMFMDPLVGIFTAGWLGLVGFVFLNFAMQGKFNSIGFLAAGAMFAMGVAIAGFGFYLEAFKAEQLLREGLESEA